MAETKEPVAQAFVEAIAMLLDAANWEDGRLCWCAERRQLKQSEEHLKACERAWKMVEEHAEACGLARLTESQ